VGRKVAVHATPIRRAVRGTGRSRLHRTANQIGDETMRLMRDKHIYALPTFAISSTSPNMQRPRSRRRASAGR